jgi:hypothetical protein
MRQRHVVERLTVAARIEGSPGDPDRMRLRAPGAHRDAALAAPHPRQRTVAGAVATATAGIRIEEVLQKRSERDAARSGSSRR